MWLKFLLLTAILLLLFTEMHAKQMKLQPIAAREVKRLLRLAKREDLLTNDRIITKGFIGRSSKAITGRSNSNSTDENEIRKLCFYSIFPRSIKHEQLGRSIPNDAIVCKPQQLSKTSIKQRQQQRPWSAYSTTKTNFAAGTGKSNYPTYSSSESDYDTSSPSDSYTEDDSNSAENQNEQIGTLTESENADADDATSVAANNNELENDDSYSTQPHKVQHSTTNNRKSGHKTAAAAAVATVLCEQPSDIATTTWNLTPSTGTTTTIVGYTNALSHTNAVTTASNVLELNAVDNTLNAPTGTADVIYDAVSNEDAENSNDANGGNVQHEAEYEQLEIIQCISLKGLHESKN